MRAKINTVANLKKPAPGKSFGELYPEAVSAWSNKNDFTPFDISAFSNVSAWWTCEFHPDAPFEAKVANMAKNNSCGCQTGHRFVKGVNDLASQYPEIAADWHEDNDTNPDEISASNKKVVLWKCNLHPTIPYSMSVFNRIKGGACTCTNTKGRKIAIAGVNDVSTLRPDLALIWHSTNTAKPTELTLKSNTIVAWLCSEHPDIPFSTRLSDMVARSVVCPCKSTGGRTTTLPGVNDLATLLPDVAAQWDDIKNGDHLPSMITVMSNELRWWKCSVNAEHDSWEAHVYQRSEGQASCPSCRHGEIVPV